MSDAVPTPEERTIRELLDQPWIDLRDPATVARVSDSLAHAPAPARRNPRVLVAPGAPPLASRLRRR